ncbi:MAG: hypothetical protein E7620_04090 [Ruminococcaceae bacterium]|nr:hypothetical protein [Oscillospiraceae bacterium]
MNSLQICALALLGITAAAVLKKWNSDFLPLIRLAVTVLIAFCVTAWMAPIISYLKQLTDTAGIGGYAEFLFKALAIAWLTGICGDLCRESGELGAANGVELAGKVEILLLSLPLLSEVLELAKKLLGAVGSS